MFMTCLVCLGSVLVFVVGTSVFKVNELFSYLIVDKIIKHIKQHYEMLKIILLLQIPLIFLYLYDQGYLNIRSGKQYHRQNSWNSGSRRY